MKKIIKDLDFAKTEPEAKEKARELRNQGLKDIHYKLANSGRGFDVYQLLDEEETKWTELQP